MEVGSAPREVCPRSRAGLSRSERPASPVIVWLHIYISATLPQRFRFLFSGAAHCSPVEREEERKCHLAWLRFRAEGACQPPPLLFFFFSFLDHLAAASGREGGRVCFDANLDPSPSLSGVLHPVGCNPGGRYHCEGRGFKKRADG